MCICLFGIALILNIKIPPCSLFIAYFQEMVNHHKSKNGPFVTSRYSQGFCSMFNKELSFFNCGGYVYQNLCKCTSARVYANVLISDLKLFMGKYRNFLQNNQYFNMIKNQAKLAIAAYEVIYSVHFVSLESKAFSHKECFFHDVVYDIKGN